MKRRALLSRAAKRGDPLRALAPTEPCWCGSGKPYRDCHGRRGLEHPPGAPLPSEVPGRLYLAPNRFISDATFAQWRNQVLGLPIYAPSARDEVRPARASLATIHVAQSVRPAPSTGDDAEPMTHDVRILGRQRFEVLNALGLDDSSTLARRTQELAAREIDDLRLGLLNLAQLTIERLLEEADAALPPTSIWAPPGSDPLATISSTVFWADHYLVPDDVLDAAIAEPIDPAMLTSAISEALETRALVENGLMVPVATSVVEVIADKVAGEATVEDLQRRELVRWVRRQVLLTEGPTDREVIFFRLRDEHLRREYYYLRSEILHESLEHQPDGALRMRSRFLGPYRPEFNYQPWIAQSRRQVAVDVLHEANVNLALADAFGAHLVARTPFQGRLLQRTGRLSSGGAQALAWADVPALIDGDPRSLAKVVGDEDAVEALRHSVRTNFRTVASLGAEDAHRAAREYVREMRSQANQFRKTISRERRWGLLAPFVLGAASLALGASPQVAGTLSVAAAATTPLLQYRLLRADRNRRAAYAILLGSPRADKPVAHDDHHVQLYAGPIRDSVLTP